MKIYMNIYPYSYAGICNMQSINIDLNIKVFFFRIRYRKNIVNN